MRSRDARFLLTESIEDMRQKFARRSRFRAARTNGWAQVPKDVLEGSPDSLQRETLWPTI
jgi:hypothetical protein